jgi:hypothetical protein
MTFSSGVRLKSGQRDRFKFGQRATERDSQILYPPVATADKRRFCSEHSGNRSDMDFRQPVAVLSADRVAWDI